MTPLERLSAAWRDDYVSGVSEKDHDADNGECVFCGLANEPANESTGVLFRSDTSFITLNAFPYGSGHLLVLPRRHVASLQELRDDEYTEFFWTMRKAVVALEATYHPDGMNVGFNLGHAAGAGIPKHLHGHVLPRWTGDTNFMTTIGETRVLSESLVSTWQKVHAHL